MLELTIMLATFVRAARFEIARDFDPRPSGQMFLLPERGMPMKVVLR
jgi:cytochrome P450